MNEPIPVPLTNRSSKAWPWNWRSSQTKNAAGPRGTESNLPAISIVIPSYNQGRFLEAAIRSVLLQRYPRNRVECYVMDGGSTDETKQILEYYSPWLAGWVSESDRGQAHAINKGLDRASGDLLSFLNSDDFYAPGCFLATARAAAANPGVGVFHGDRILLDAEGRVLGWSNSPQFSPHHSGYTISSETAFWRKIASPSRMPFDEALRFALDLDFFGQLYARKVQFLKLNRFQGCFRCHADAKSVTMQDVCQEESVRLWRKHFGVELADQKPAGGSKLKLLLRGMQSPSLVLFPYIRYKLERIVNR